MSGTETWPFIYAGMGLDEPTLQYIHMIIEAFVNENYYLYGIYIQK